MNAVTIGERKPQAQAMVLENPYTVPIMAGAISGMIGKSPPVCAPMKSMEVTRQATVIWALFWRQGMRRKQIPGPISAAHKKRPNLFLVVHIDCKAHSLKASKIFRVFVLESHFFIITYLEKGPLIS